MISRAKRYAYISTPYFVVDDEMLSVIQNTAKSGVDVRIIVPHIPDKFLVNQVTKSYYERLISAGVRVYEYEKGFNHSKLLCVDDEIATVGSVNFDYRSFRYQYELALIGTESTMLPQLRQHFDSTLKHCISFDYQEWKKRSFFQRLSEVILLPFRYLF